MATITSDQIKELRESTGVSVMQCKKALEEAGGDMAKAVVILKKKGAEAAAKKGDRTLAASMIQAYIHATGTVGTMVELACETDFVAKNPEFKQLAYDIAMHIAASKPEFVKKEDITPEAQAVAESVFEKEVEGKPAEMKAKILEGKLAAYFGERVLLDQPFIKNPELTIAALISQAVQKFGEKIEIVRFVRFGA
ncbi:MAG: elongation factor Ts [Patescibacteria group bacterium]|nr:elongation factor Ts [Patescibacteria group bacterium]MDE2116746.1 elongation factor Ts [Patescibacteria group bacterium]